MHNPGGTKLPTLTVLWSFVGYSLFPLKATSLRILNACPHIQIHLSFNCIPSPGDYRSSFNCKLCSSQNSETNPRRVQSLDLFCLGFLGWGEDFWFGNVPGRPSLPCCSLCNSSDSLTATRMHAGEEDPEAAWEWPSHCKAGSQEAFLEGEHWNINTVFLTHLQAASRRVNLELQSWKQNPLKWFVMMGQLQWRCHYSQCLGLLQCHLCPTTVKLAFSLHLLKNYLKD